MLAVIAGMSVLADEVGPLVGIPLWIAHGVLLVVLIGKSGTPESGLGAALFIVLTSAASVYVMDVARDDLTLQRRGEKVTVTVVEERPIPVHGRGSRMSDYELEHEDGTRVPGPALNAETDLYAVGQKITVIEDPTGELRPQTLGEADATGDALTAAAAALAALGAVPWAVRRGAMAKLRRDEEATQAAARQNQENRLREALRTRPPVRGAYIDVTPEDYPALTHARAARIAWETGLKAEAAGDRRVWRFGETVVEEVPLD
ncbi:hypothetical protein [Streptomyces sp. TRM68416]|uniref:hypothetical protein n=1 Tax=Streptomyces sp. TRM68416 TaxID=2758412 RepID=UPI001661ACE8|nr:hypothetical protein [Streptomyces sp. TRM68416]MBD0842761.1 hypothetical protein [Streptomyces sp. TRM68416]